MSTMPQSLKDAIIKLKQRYADDIEDNRLDLAHEVIKLYVSQYRYIPEEWSAYMRTVITKRMVWEVRLLEKGIFTQEEIKEMSFSEIREIMEELELQEVEVHTALPSGGISVSKVLSKRVA